MSDSIGPISLAGPGGPSASRIRQEFDLSFASPPRGSDTGAIASYLRIRVGNASFAVALEEISGLATGRKVVPVPGAFPGLLGVVGYRGGLYPVVALGMFLGHPASEDPRWLVLVRQTEPLALAFDAFEGHLRLPAGRPAPARSDPPAPGPSGVPRGALQSGEALLPLLDLPSLSREITKRAGSRAPRQER